MLPHQHYGETGFPDTFCMFGGVGRGEGGGNDVLLTVTACSFERWSIGQPVGWGTN